MHPVPLVVLIEGDNQQFITTEPAQDRRRAVAAENGVALLSSEATEASDLREEDLVLAAESSEPFRSDVVRYLGEVTQVRQRHLAAGASCGHDLTSQQDAGRPALKLAGDGGDHVDVGFDPEQGQQSFGLGKIEGQRVDVDVYHAGLEPVPSNPLGMMMRTSSEDDRRVRRQATDHPIDQMRRLLTDKVMDVVQHQQQRFIETAHQTRNLIERRATRGIRDMVCGSATGETSTQRMTQHDRVIINRLEVEPADPPFVAGSPACHQRRLPVTRRRQHTDNPPSRRIETRIEMRALHHRGHNTRPRKPSPIPDS